MAGSAILFVYVRLFHPTHSDFYEWVIVYMYLNALGIINLANKFYETVHEEFLAPPMQARTVTYQQA